MALSFFINTVLIVNAVNIKRALHCSPPVTYSNIVEQSAQSWSNYLAINNGFFHSDNDYGENLALIGTQDATQAVLYAIDLWYNEYYNYNYFQPGFSMITGHFTQLVWKSTIEIGVGIALNSNNQYVVTMEFNPPGNVDRQYTRNVVGRCEIFENQAPFTFKISPKPPIKKNKRKPPPPKKRKQPKPKII